MDWCEEQCRVNKIAQAIQEASKGESEGGVLGGSVGLSPRCAC